MKITIPSLKSLKEVKENENIYTLPKASVEEEWEDIQSQPPHNDTKHLAHLQDLELFKSINHARVEFETGQQSVILAEQNVVKKIRPPENLENQNVLNLQFFCVDECKKIVEKCENDLKNGIKTERLVAEKIDDFYFIEIGRRIKVFLTRTDFLFLGFDGVYELPTFRTSFCCSVACHNLIYEGSLKIEEGGLKGYKKYLKIKRFGDFVFGDVEIKIEEKEVQKKSLLIDFIGECILAGVEKERIGSFVQYYCGIEMAGKCAVEGWEEENGDKIYYFFDNSVKKCILSWDGKIECKVIKELRK